LSSIKKYVRVTKEFPAFKTIDFKWSDGIGNDFPRIEIRVRDEIVTFGVPEEIKVNENGIIGGGVHLKPVEVNQLVAERGDDVVFFDGRSAYEARIGRFKNAVIPDVETTPDFVAEIGKLRTTSTNTSGGVSKPNGCGLPIFSLIILCPAASKRLASSSTGPRMSYKTLANLCDCIISMTVKATPRRLSATPYLSRHR